MRLAFYVCEHFYAARARHFLDGQGASGRVTLIITRGLRPPIYFAKALALEPDGIALSNSALQTIGCVAARMCATQITVLLTAFLAFPCRKTILDNN
ncbi:glutamate synthase-related protein [Nitrosomonas mobilis]|uniref:glutamate synthase-related protein n=1 Tax=Nitrosomonas mobilis TaxID=51642 RepID=UPI003CCC3C5B